jgi:hypothetical protein
VLEEPVTLIVRVEQTINILKVEAADLSNALINIYQIV